MDVIRTEISTAQNLCRYVGNSVYACKSNSLHCIQNINFIFHILHSLARRNLQSASTFCYTCSCNTLRTGYHCWYSIVQPYHLHGRQCIKWLLAYCSSVSVKRHFHNIALQWKTNTPSKTHQQAENHTDTVVSTHTLTLKSVKVTAHLAQHDINYGSKPLEYAPEVGPTQCKTCVASAHVCVYTCTQYLVCSFLFLCRLKVSVFGHNILYGDVTYLPYVCNWLEVPLYVDMV